MNFFERITKKCEIRMIKKKKLLRTDYEGIFCFFFSKKGFICNRYYFEHPFYQ
jgi:hypothetical protein